MVKIHIVGGSGSGKTTLAQDISSHLHIPHYDLDKLSWEVEDAQAIAEQSAWITEGIYLLWTDPLLYSADCIVFLEVLWPIATWRMLYRHISNSLHGTQPYPGLNGLRALLKLLQDTRNYSLNKASPEIQKAIRLYFEEQGAYTARSDVVQLPMLLERYEELSLAPTEAFVRQYLERYKEKVFLVKNSSDRERLLKYLRSR